MVFTISVSTYPSNFKPFYCHRLHRFSQINSLHVASTLSCWTWFSIFLPETSSLNFATLLVLNLFQYLCWTWFSKRIWFSRCKLGSNYHGTTSFHKNDSRYSFIPFHYTKPLELTVGSVSFLKHRIIKLPSIRVIFRNKNTSFFF